MLSMDSKAPMPGIGDKANLSGISSGIGSSIGCKGSIGSSISCGSIGSNGYNGNRDSLGCISCIDSLSIISLSILLSLVLLTLFALPTPALSAPAHALPVQVEIKEVSPLAPKPVINRLDQMNVYALAPSAYLLQSGHMLSLELYKNLKTSSDLVKFKQEINQAARATGIAAALIAAIIMTESGFNPQAKSSAGARGLMQLMPETMLDLGVDDPFDSTANINAGAAYLKKQINRFKRLDLALAAYNAGPANVTKYGGIPPFAETQHFIRKVKAYYQHYASLSFAN